LVTALSAAYLARGFLGKWAQNDLVCGAHELITERISAWQAHPREAGVVRAVLFGDSVTLKPDGEGLLGSALALALAGHRVRTDLLEVTYPGLSVLPFFYSLERIVAGQPAVAVVEVNLRTFAEDWGAENSLRFRRLAALLSLRQALANRSLLATQ